MMGTEAPAPALENPGRKGLPHAARVANEGSILAPHVPWALTEKTKQAKVRPERRAKGIRALRSQLWFGSQPTASQLCDFGYTALPLCLLCQNEGVLSLFSALTFCDLGIMHRSPNLTASHWNFLKKGFLNKRHAGQHSHQFRRGWIF